MYPLNVCLPEQAGFAVANDAREHAELTRLGYVPALDDTGDAIEEARAALSAKGIKFDGRWGLDRLLKASR